MKLLENKSNVDAPSGTWPFGNTRDKTLLVPGTKWDNEMMSDIIQFFAKMFNNSGLIANGNFDNETNGYQLFEALQKMAGTTFKKTIPIGIWDMDTDAVLSVAHGLTDKRSIRSCTAIIFDDDDLVSAFLELGGEGAIGIIDDTNITLARANGGFFDSTNFNDNTVNRGYLTIEYVE